MPPISVLRRHLGGLERSIDELRLSVKGGSSNIGVGDLSGVSRSLMTKPCPPGGRASVNDLELHCTILSKHLFRWQRVILVVSPLEIKSLYASSWVFKLRMNNSENVKY